MIRRARRWDASAALIAALIGVLALLVSAYTAYIQRQQVRAQVWPYLLVSAYGEEHIIGVLNKGVGPAIVKTVRISVDGKPQRDWKRVLEALEQPTAGIGISTISNNVISAGERIPAIKIADETAYRRLRNELGVRLGMEICFCSTLDECWLYSNRDAGERATQTAVSRCPAVASAQAFED